MATCCGIIWWVKEILWYFKLEREEVREMVKDEIHEMTSALHFQMLSL